MLIVLVSLREVPHGALWLIVAASAQNCRACVFVNVLVGPLPNVADKVLDAVGTCPGRVRINRFGSLPTGVALQGLPFLTPGPDTPVRSARIVSFSYLHRIALISFPSYSISAARLHADAREKAAAEYSAH